MPTAILYFFTGTGNTRICAQFLKKHLEERGWSVDLYEYHKPIANVPDPNKYDYVGIGYPIHAFNTPSAFVKFIKHLPKVDSKKLFFFKTSGEPFHFNDSSSHHIWAKLKKKGFRLIMEKHFLMPYNIMFRYKDGLVKQMYLYLDALTNLMAERLASGEEDIVRFPLSHQLLSLVLRIEWVAPSVNCAFAHINRKKCSDCGLCIKSCPNAAILKNEKGKIHITHKCSICMRCTMACPKDAINFGFLNHWRVNGAYKFMKLMEDDSVDPAFVNQNTKGYFKLFRKYFRLQNRLLERYGILIPVTYATEDELS